MRVDVAKPSFEGASPRDVNVHHFAIQRALARCALVGEKLHRRSEDEDLVSLGDVFDVVDDGRGFTVKSIHCLLPTTRNGFLRLFYEFEEIEGRHGIFDYSPAGRYREFVGALRVVHGRNVFLPCRYRFTLGRDFVADHIPEPSGTILSIAVPASRTGALCLLDATREHPSIRRQVEAFLDPDTGSEFKGLFGRFALQEIEGGHTVVGCDAFRVDELRWPLEALVDEAVSAVDGYSVVRCRTIALQADALLADLGDMRKLTRKAIVERLETFRDLASSR